MKLSRYAGIALALLIIASIAFYTVPSLASEDMPERERKFKIVRFQAEIVHVSDVGVEVLSEVYNGTILAKGKWLYISGDLGERPWKAAIDMIELGEAKILMAVSQKRGKNLHILLGIKQDGLILMRGSFTMRSIVDQTRIKGFLSVTGEVVKTGEDYLVLRVRENNLLFRIAPTLNWTVPGNGTVTWGEVRYEFTRGDLVQVYFHEVVRFNDLFAEFTGIRAIAGGYGTIIDLSDGLTITKA